MKIIKRIKYTDIFAYLTGITSSLLIAEFSDDTIWPFLGFFLFVFSIFLVLYPSVLLATQLYPSFKSIRSLAVSHLVLLVFGWILVYSVIFINPWLAFIGILFLLINLRYQYQIQEAYEPSEDPNEFTWLTQDSNSMLRVKMLLLFGLGLAMVFQFTLYMDSLAVFLFKMLLTMIGIFTLFIYYRYAYQWVKDYKRISISIIGILAAIVYIQFDMISIISIFIGALPTLFLERKITEYVINNRDS